MSEAISRLNATEVEEEIQVIEEETPTVVNEEIAQEEVITDSEGNQLTGFNEEYIKDGKLFGKWENPNDMAQSYKKLQDEKAQEGRKAKDDETQIEKEQRVNSIEKDIVGKLAETGFKPTEDDYTAWEETGKPRAELELKAIKLEQSTNRIYEMVGGADKAVEIAEWAKDNLSKEDLTAFNKEVSDGTEGGVSITSSGEFALRGLLSMYNESNGNPTQVSKGTRLQGKQSVAKQGGYNSKSEVNEALNHLRKNPRDTAGQREYEAKMKLTDISRIR